MTNVLVTIYDSAGAPKSDATPTFVAVRSTTGGVLSSPTITNLGNGNYGFELDGNAGYLISTGANPLYVAGGVGDGVWSGLYDSAGVPKADATPTVALYSWTGGSLGGQIITNAGGGLYYFNYTQESIFKMTTGCMPAYYDGTIELAAQTQEIVVPPPVSVQENVSEGYVQYKINTSSGLPVLDADGKRIRLSRSDSLAQALWFRLARFQGEWKYDLDSGLTYNDWNEIPNANLTAIRQTVMAELFKVKDVAAVNNLIIELDSNHNLTIAANIKCSDGTIVALGV